MRAIIVDDEFLSRQRLRDLLSEFADVTVVGEANNGEQGRELIATKSPDLAFLDIQMPRKDGLSILEGLENGPMVIFTTAYDQYAVKAFEKDALDYLLKPFDKDRLDQALRKARRRIHERRTADLTTKFQRLLTDMQAESSLFLEKIVIREKGRDQIVLLQDVSFIESFGNYVKLHVADKKFLYRMSMNKLQEELNPKQWLRVHRSYILNIHEVRGQKYAGNNEYTFTMHTGKQLISGRSFKERIDDFLEKL